MYARGGETVYSVVELKDQRLWLTIVGNKHNWNYAVYYHKEAVLSTA